MHSMKVTTVRSSMNRQTLSKEDKMEIKSIFVKATESTMMELHYPPSHSFEKAST